MTVHAPYNFVPLAETVVLPKWGARVSHDLPFKDGASGILNFTLTNDTELIVGDGSSTQDVQQFRLPDGRAAIPGSSLRGMIRSVLEIATFSRFRQVDDSRFGVRDLTTGARPFYGRVISHEVNGAFEALSKAGWLSFDGQHWSVTPCDVARVEHDDLAILTGDNWWLSVPRDPAGNSAAKYANFDRWTAGKGLAARKIFFQPGPVMNHQHSGKLLRYRRASGLSASPAATLAAGTVVFTGQPAPRVPGTGGRKHLEFIFFGGETKVMAIDDRVMSGFLQIHDDSDEWKRMRTDARVPVFYLESTSGEIESLGLAQMYRLAYRNTVHDVVRHTSPAHLDGTDPDFCDLLFGRTDEAADASLKSRAWFEPAVARVVTPSPVRTVVLSNPKPSYYPSYVRQKAHGGNLIGDYTTWSNTNAQLRGWKRYPVRTVLTSGAPATDKVSTKLHPLPPGTRFDCRLIFHNLKREELGAILWALTWGGDRSLRHSLGMAKPYGYGSVQFEIDDKNTFEIEWNDPVRSEPPTAEELLQAFTDYMTVEAPGWSSRPQLVALKAMANPATASAVNLEYMTLDPQHRQNEFQDAKKASPHQVLPEYPGVPAVPSHAVPHPLPKATLDHPPHTAVNPVAPTDPEFWQGTTLTFGRDGGVAIITARNGQRVATEKLDALKQALTTEQAIAGLAEAEKRWRRDRPVIADATVMLRGRLSYRIIDLVFKT